MGMNVNLTPQLEDLVRAKVSSGMYASASEVVREALRLMQEQDQLREAKLEELRKDIHRGLESGPSQDWNATEVKAAARARRKSTTGAARKARVTRRPQAAVDILDIWDFIAEDSMLDADLWVDSLDEKLRLWSTQPQVGRMRAELVPELRSMPFGRYVVFFMPLPDGIDVVRSSTAHATLTRHQPIVRTHR